MRPAQSPNRYTLVAIILHWVMALGIVALAIIGLAMAHAPLARALAVHKSTLWRWLAGTRPIPSDIDARLLAVTTATAAAAAKAGAEITER